MTIVTNHPIIVFALSFITLWLAAGVGRTVLRRRFFLEDELREDFGLLLGASLTLLALIIGFCFSMATSRYDLRKNYEENEANAIGTEYLRADLLPAADAAKIHGLLKEYLDKRLQFYLAADDAELHTISDATSKLQSDLWSAVLAPSGANPTPVVALAVSGMNDVLNSQGYTQAAWWNRIPTAAWALMMTIGIGCNVLVGYGLKGARSGSRLLPILPLIIAIAFTLIADIDAPRHGIIRVSPQNLMSAAQSMR
jgi:hypothetical protein